MIIGFSTLFTLEVERVWLFMSPFVLAPVGQWLTRSEPADRALSGVQRFAGALAVNTLLAETLLKIQW